MIEPVQVNGRQVGQLDCSARAALEDRVNRLEAFAKAAFSEVERLRQRLDAPDDNSSDGI
ncbi:MAG: hypothetical protein FJZ00_14075 [Candidatus Sericytochromatia bacterium]|uniref:Uncharacterized protein n=1 Tax=Candidatus Tanganyikabacteria bacterium TaxID=2961651 RepID=A0A937X7P9_9BACT|nr:hypothetical protein [Candidatus Tanganyikabacteria bacterium]